MAQGSPPDDVVVRGRFPTAGGSGPDDPNVEARLARLESGMDAVRLDLAEIKGKLSNIPTTFQLVFILACFVVTIFAAAFGLLKLAALH